MTDETDMVPPRLTESNPELGVVSALGIPILKAEHWIEDGVHVLRSTEVDVVAGDPDFKKALEQFGQKAEDLWAYLSDLETITDNENETFLLLAPRFRELFRELEHREQVRQRKVFSVTLHRRRNHLRDWQPLSQQRNSSVASPA